jgi:hypothetical protein
MFILKNLKAYIHLYVTKVPVLVLWHVLHALVYPVRDLWDANKLHRTMSMSPSKT